MTTACSFLTAQTRNAFKLDPKLIDRVEEDHGLYAKRRLLAWQELIQNDQSVTDMEKLEKVNTFFNRLDFISDISHWQQEDYWATPVEFLATGGGDCEDFSLAKYFTLKKMGVDENKLNMTYVKALKLSQAHMVITYYRTPDAEPLVLDNLDAEIRPASQRSDLLPVYSFNGVGLWLAKSRGRGQMVGGSDRLKRWQDLLQRLPDGLN
ncbi:MAG: sulfate adenylyltransferase [Desulfobulbaceae bacterium]|nr:MAG: sulfate adenylyltransferase [Desulfobulbaceae bacterium]